MVQKKVADQGLANKIQGFKILGCCDASEKKEVTWLYFFFVQGLEKLLYLLDLNLAGNRITEIGEQ